MLKRKISYTDFNDEKQEAEFYFNISRAELVKLEASFDDGIQKALETMLAEKDKSAILNQFEKIVLTAYGEKSEDGQRFMKSPGLQDEFRQHAAYDQLFFELITNEQTIADFILGVLPKDLAQQVSANLPQDKPRRLPPTPPVKPT